MIEELVCLSAVAPWVRLSWVVGGCIMHYRIVSSLLSASISNRFCADPGLKSTGKSLNVSRPEKASVLENRGTAWKMGRSSRGILL